MHFYRHVTCVVPGAAHSESAWNDDKVYGDNVVDMCDFSVFDWETKLWLNTPDLTLYEMRGGVNAVVPLDDGILITGGMHSDEGQSMPAFKPNLYFLTSSW